MDLPTKVQLPLLSMDLSYYVRHRMTQLSPLLYSNDCETLLYILPVEFFFFACDLYKHIMYILTLLAMLSQYLAIINTIL